MMTGNLAAQGPVFRLGLGAGGALLFVVLLDGFWGCAAAGGGKVGGRSWVLAWVRI
jgi:hypothetical protein